MPNPMTSSERITRAQNATEVLELRVAGHTLDAIGRRMGFSAARAHQIVKEELCRINSLRNETAVELRTLEAERLDRMLLAIWPMVEAGQLYAIDRVLRVMERRARLLGLDAQPNTLSQDQAFQLVRMLIAAVEDCTDPATAARIRARIGQAVGCQTLALDSREVESRDDREIDSTPSELTSETVNDPPIVDEKEGLKPLSYPFRPEQPTCRTSG